jgi:hypothetical protein
VGVQVAAAVVRARPAVRAARSTDADPARGLAGKAFILFGAFGLLAALSRNASAPMVAGEALFGAIDVAIGVLLLGEAEWPRIAAIIRSVLGIGSALLSPLVFRNASEQFVLLALMVFFFFGGMLILLPGSAGKGRRWAGALIALVPYFLLKLLGAAQFAGRTGFFEAGEVLRGFLQMG